MSYAPVAQCLSEIFACAVHRHNGFLRARRIGKASRAHGIHHETAKFHTCGLQLKLQKIVHKAHGKKDIVKEILQARAQLMRRDSLPAAIDRIGHVEIEFVIKTEPKAIPTFKGIINLRSILAIVVIELI